MGMLLRRHYANDTAETDPDFKKAEEAFKAAKSAETATAEKAEKTESPRGRKRKEQ